VGRVIPVALGLPTSRREVNVAKPTLDYYRAVLLAISELVMEDNARWKDKARFLSEIARAEGYDGTLEEFLSWFDDGELDA
jgi:hypothetical protein